MFTTSHLSTAALLLAALAAACPLLDWAVPRDSAAALLAESQRLRAAGEEIPADYAARARVAVAVKGTEAPFHGVIFLIVAVAGALLVAVGASAAKVEDRTKAAEGLLRGGGAVLALAFMLALFDMSSSLFTARDRGAGLWAAMALSIAAALASTFASAQVSPSDVTVPPPDPGDSAAL